jgi:hypothetical protein
MVCPTFTSLRLPPVGPLRNSTRLPSSRTKVGRSIRARSAMMPWMSWWNWLRRPPSRPYQFLVVIEARQRLWSFTGATPMTLVAPWKAARRRPVLDPGGARTFSVWNSPAEGRNTRAPAATAACWMPVR